MGDWIQYGLKSLTKQSISVWSPNVLTRGIFLNVCKTELVQTPRRHPTPVGERECGAICSDGPQFGVWPLVLTVTMPKFTQLTLTQWLSFVNASAQTWRHTYALFGVGQVRAAVSAHVCRSFGSLGWLSLARFCLAEWSDGGYDIDNFETDQFSCPLLFPPPRLPKCLFLSLGYHLLCDIVCLCVSVCVYVYVCVYVVCVCVRAWTRTFVHTICTYRCVHAYVSEYSLSSYTVKGLLPS